VWDRPRRRLLLARDRFGKKPLVWFKTPRRFAFASTITALIRHADAPRELDRLALARYLAFEFVPAPQSLFEGVQKLPPAHSLVLEEQAEPRLTRYWRLDAAPPGTRAPSMRDAGQRVREMLDAAVRRRLIQGWRNQDRLEVWTIQGSTAEKHTIWTPYEEMQGAERDVLWAEFLDADTLATSSRHGRVVLWKFPEIEPLCTLNMGVDGATPALSPDRRLIAYLTSSDVGLFDVTKREVIAQKPIADKLLSSPRRDRE